MNKYSLAFEPQVQQDLQQAYDYYFYKANFDIAEKFLQHVNSAFDTLEINPFYEIRTKNLRVILLHLSRHYKRLVKIIIFRFYG